MSIWNQGQKELLKTEFIAENQPDAEFWAIPLPCTFCFNGDAYRKVGFAKAKRLDNGQVIELADNAPCKPQARTKLNTLGHRVFY